MEEKRTRSIEIRTVLTSDSFNIVIEGDVIYADEEWQLNVVPVIAIKNEKNEIAVLNLSIADNGHLTEIFAEHLNRLSDRKIEAFRLQCDSEISNAKLFSGKNRQPLSLKILIDFEDENFISSPVEAFIARNPSATRKAYKQPGEEFSTLGILSLFCFPVWSGNPFTGTWLTVCAGRCFGPFSCECLGKGGGVCTGWHNCVCGLTIFGIHVPILLILFLGLLVPLVTYLIFT